MEIQKCNRFNWHKHGWFVCPAVGSCTPRPNDGEAIVSALRLTHAHLLSALPLCDGRVGPAKAGSFVPCRLSVQNTYQACASRSVSQLSHSCHTWHNNWLYFVPNRTCTPPCPKQWAGLSDDSVFYTFIWFFFTYLAILLHAF